MRSIKTGISLVLSFMALSGNCLAGTTRITANGITFPDDTEQTTKASGDHHSLDSADGNATDVVYVDNNGKVGVGTTTPGSALEVSGTVTATAFIGNGAALTGVIGIPGPAGPQGDKGDNGDSGAPGAAGINCWDLDSNHLCDLSAEDMDDDNACTVNDCAGPQGEPGETGPAGTSSWTDGDGVVTTSDKVAAGGGIKIGTDSSSCDTWAAGTIRWSGSAFEGCDGTAWRTFSFLPSDAETVVSAGQIWMARNLGSTQAATSTTDSAAYGDLYQWGRKRDGHQLRSSATTSTVSSADDPEHDDFITVVDAPYDWRVPQNDNLWQGASGINNPCPAGFRLPTSTEWDTESAAWTSKNTAGAFASPLKLAVAGYRGGSAGAISDAGISGNYWSSTVNGSNARYLYFYSGNGFVAIKNRMYGLSVRCLKD